MRSQKGLNRCSALIYQRSQFTKEIIKPEWVTRRILACQGFSSFFTRCNSSRCTRRMSPQKHSRPAHLRLHYSLFLHFTASLHLPQGALQRFNPQKYGRSALFGALLPISSFHRLASSPTGSASAVQPQFKEINCVFLITSEVKSFWGVFLST